MQELLPFYERELAYLRRYGREFAERYPRIANRLLLSADGSQDPHVERLIESFAFLGARISKRIEDDYPEFTDALLEVLYPHYLRPFPSCSIARFDLGPGASRLSAPVRLPRGTMLSSRPVRGVSCRFRTTSDVALLPLTITAASHRPVAQAPMATRLPAGAGGQISLRFGLASDQASFASLGDGAMRLFVDGEPSFCAAARDALALGVLGTYVEADDDGRWRAMDAPLLRQAGFSDADALIDYPRRSHPAYRLLTELFAFPEKFGFFDLDLPRACAGASRAFTVHLVLRGGAGDHADNRVLEHLGPANVLLGCTPVVNLFAQHGEPIRITHRTATYPVVADARRAWAYEVSSIDSVQRVRTTPQGEQVMRYRPFYSLQHGEDPERSGAYWMSRRDEDVARSSPGFETEIAFVDVAFSPTLPRTDVASVELTCTNRDLPAHLAYGVQGGDLSMEGGSPARAIALLRKPTRSLRFRRGRAAQWRLISHLSLNSLSLTQDALPAIREMLRLYDIAGSGVTARQIEGIAGIEHRAATAWLPGRHFASVVRGVEIRMTIDPAAFVGVGIAAFAGVMDRFFGLYVHANSFTQLTLLSIHDDEVLIRCEPRSGDSILV
ncbi:type VI secretion system baseplate subunit TssF [Luteimonas sp. FCS-9]|uniref:type VI secretion system baseplate subunit TssF n=1 Tax=Luteimonas sp. FCS-9 TaxID=1547516 RepID=UPI00063EADD8|nr:type VI secretion system baseplate subunit TssF [Luteimonas sp. FCS-9]KLJ01991.1 type VI secretion protein [Luteimonas sp. FCS-9]